MPRKPAFFWWTVALGTALVLCYAVSAIEFWRHAGEDKNYGWTRNFRDGSWYVYSVDPKGPAAGTLRAGDRILKFEGYNGPDWVVFRIVGLAPAGGALHLTLLRGAERIDARVPVYPVRKPMDHWILLLAGASLVCFAVALLMGLMKPADRAAQFGGFTFLALAAILLMKSLVFVYWQMDDWGHVMFGLLSAADPLPLATGYLFGCRFPKKPAAGPAWRIVSLLVCAAVVVEWFVMLPPHLVGALNLAWTIRLGDSLDTVLRQTMRVSTGIWTAERVLICAAIAAVLVRNYRALPQPDLRRRLRWIMMGIVGGLAPMTAVYLGIAAFYLTGHGIRTTEAWFLHTEYICIAFLGTVAAIAVGYGVLRHRLLDIHVVLRASIQHLLAKRVLQAAISLPILFLAARAILNPQITVRHLLFGSYFYLAVAAAAALGLAYRRKLLIALDRRFFREHYNQEQILRTLIEEIKESDSITEISQLVSRKLEAALHPERILVFCRTETHGDFTLGHSSTGHEPELKVSADCPLLRFLEESPKPRDFPLSDAAGIPSTESVYFEKLGVRLLAPITGAEHRLLGVLMLGEKRSATPYTGADRDLLQAIAGQIGVVYENIALRESARREAQIKRSVLAHLDGGQINLLKECPRCGACFDRAADECTGDGSHLTLTLPVDRTVDGIYRLERRVGTGAMGAVYQARDLRLGRTVAVKIMVGSLFGNSAALRRFEREARAAARLSHPNIVAIHDFGTLGTDGAYMVMEMVEGRTLRAELRSHGAIDPSVAAEWIDQLLEGLSSAHAKGIVHRDLKPENLIVAHLVGGGELVKILDFGLAKVMPEVSAETASLTAAGAVVGTMGYMSPEQLLGEEVDDRTDTFAVGVLVIECLTGRRPFAGLSFQELLHATLQGPALISGEAPAIVRLNSILARCLSKQREGRPGIAGIRSELVEAIRRCPALAAMRSAVAEESTIDATRHFH